MKIASSILGPAIMALLSAVPGHSADDYFRIKNNDSSQYTVYVFEKSATQEVKKQHLTFWYYTTKNYRVVVPGGRTVGFDTAWVKASRPEERNHVFKFIIEGGEGGNKEFWVRNMKASFAYKFMISDDPDKDESSTGDWYGLREPCTIVITNKTLSIAPR